MCERGVEPQTDTSIWSWHFKDRYLDNCCQKNYRADFLDWNAAVDPIHLTYTHICAHSRTGKCHTHTCTHICAHTHTREQHGLSMSLSTLAWVLKLNNTSCVRWSQLRSSCTSTCTRQRGGISLISRRFVDTWLSEKRYRKMSAVSISIKDTAKSTCTRVIPAEFRWAFSGRSWSRW